MDLGYPLAPVAGADDVPLASLLRDGETCTVRLKGADAAAETTDAGVLVAGPVAPAPNLPALASGLTACTEQHALTTACAGPCTDCLCRPECGHRPLALIDALLTARTAGMDSWRRPLALTC